MPISTRPSLSRGRHRAQSRRCSNSQHLHDERETVCEIGPGSGRYAEEVIAALHSDTYLKSMRRQRTGCPTCRKLPNAVIRACDGHTLSQTSSASVHLVHAQKVFVYLQF